MDGACNSIVWDETFWDMVQKGGEMRREEDCLRDLLLRLEADESWFYTFAADRDDEAGSDRELYHLILLADAGLLERYGRANLTFRLTNAGHDFIAMTRQSEAWEAVKAAGSRVGGASVQMLFRIAEGYARQKLAALGLPPG